LAVGYNVQKFRPS